MKKQKPKSKEAHSNPSTVKLRKSKEIPKGPSGEEKEGLAPFYDVQHGTSEINTDVEISKASIVDSFQTDSRPK